MTRRSPTKGLRITGGALRGRRVAIARGTRPTQERVREALFSRWQTRLSNSSILELFCGSGVVTMEALSRGANLGFLVDTSANSLNVVAQNLARLGLKGASAQADLPTQWHKLPQSWPQTFDLIFLDPPYALDALGEVLEMASSRLGSDGELAFEHDIRRRLATPDTLEMVDQRRYGETALSFYRPAS